MRTLARIIFGLVLAWAIAACVGPGSPSPINSAPEAPASEVPVSPSPGSFEPGQPKPTIEVPPPID